MTGTTYNLKRRDGTIIRYKPLKPIATLDFKFPGLPGAYQTPTAADIGRERRFGVERHVAYYVEGTPKPIAHNAASSGGLSSGEYQELNGDPAISMFVAAIRKSLQAESKEKYILYGMVGVNILVSICSWIW